MYQIVDEMAILRLQRKINRGRRWKAIPNRLFFVGAYNERSTEDDNGKQYPIDYSLLAPTKKDQQRTTMESNTQ
jgi:hypothetical protein